ncbi:tyrosine-type recombinase/integrase [Streptomyces sp. TRM70350]|uniref:tyrosine-type recombinase/integrase n=1 Tax=Streptomyces sp. TRM70350 TaxID=2856165 RepID=UPI0027DF2BD5|nr:tyrosine-type recombinase/integrase [Streptomyces sp. TRM70350]
MTLPDCVLPPEGWGRVILHITRPQAGRKWTDTGRLHDERGLKGRPPGDARPVPLPPELVALWRESVDTFGTADDGRLFFNERGGVLAPSRYGRVWHGARELALSPGLVSTPLAARPYDLRHSAVSGSNDVVDPRVLVNAVQAWQLPTSVSYVGSWDRCRGRRLVAFYAVLYYAGLRPAEAVGLRLSDCHLPEKGWGTLTLRETRPVSGKQWTDSGERHDRRGLKAREASTDRPVPIPPVLVAILQADLKEFGTAKEGRVFGNERGGVVGSSTYWRVWEEAREYALPPEAFDSPLAGRPYDLRHACITRWLNAGVPIAEVARRVGSSPEVIHQRYHGCIDGHEEAANAKITKVLVPHQRTFALWSCDAPFGRCMWCATRCHSPRILRASKPCASDWDVSLPSGHGSSRRTSERQRVCAGHPPAGVR